MNENEIELETCPDCGENAWDGYICHDCGHKDIGE
jgi:ribosomal protein L32